MQKTLAVVSQTGESLSFYNLHTGVCTAQVSNLIAEPHELAFDKSRNLLYLSHTYRHGNYWVHGPYAHEISIVDTNTKCLHSTIDTRPALGPHGMVVDANADLLYVAVEELSPGSSGGLIVIDLSAREVKKNIASESKPHWFLLTPDSKKAYTCNKSQPFISVLDIESQSVLCKIDFPTCEEPSMSPDGRYAYFPTPGTTLGAPAKEPCLKVIDTSTDSIIHSVPMERGAQSVHVTPQGAILVGNYVFGKGTPADAGWLAVYKPDTWECVGEVEIGGIPLTMRASEDGRFAFAANILRGTVSVVDLEALAVVRTLEVDLVLKEGKKTHLGAHGWHFCLRLRKREVKCF